MTNYKLSDTVEYQCQANINIYDSDKCDYLATLAANGRHLQIIGSQEISPNTVMVKLLEDDYSGWLVNTDFENILLALGLYEPCIFSRVSKYKLIWEESLLLKIYHPSKLLEEVRWANVT